MMKFLLKLLSSVACGLIGIHLVSLFVFHFDENFSARAFEHGFKKEYCQKVQSLDTRPLNEVFSQQFHYLANGKQMTAFASDDGKYVLKLFNPMRPLKPKWYRHLSRWQQYSSLKWISREWFGKQARLKKLFLRNKIAYERLKEETGLIYVHLTPSDAICHYIHLTNKRGDVEVLSLEKTPFVLQERAELVPHRLHMLARKKDTQGLSDAKKALETLFTRRIEEKVTDRIQTLSNNYGFIGDRAIQIDFGRIRLDPEMETKAEQERIMHNLNQWLIQHAPLP
jgi:hypothetical protein